VTHEGPFWDVMEGRVALPPAAALLDWELVSVDPEAGAIEVAFTATERFLNPIGVIQGGLLTACSTTRRAQPGRVLLGRANRHVQQPGRLGQACGPDHYDLAVVLSGVPQGPAGRRLAPSACPS
jgi:hypothetical protein